MKKLLTSALVLSATLITSAAIACNCGCSESKCPCACHNQKAAAENIVIEIAKPIVESEAKTEEVKVEEQAPVAEEVQTQEVKEAVKEAADEAAKEVLVSDVNQAEEQTPAVEETQAQEVKETAEENKEEATEKAACDEDCKCGCHKKFSFKKIKCNCKK